jgi:hypothetical protein
MLFQTLDYIYWHLNKEIIMNEPNRLPLTDTPVSDKVKKIPMPSLENEIYDLIAKHKDLKEKREANAN